MQLCPVCGNEIPGSSLHCPFCRSKLDQGGTTTRPESFHKTVNLEEGRPMVETALKKLTVELASARRENYRVVTLIHGYGSSGKGGVIGRECRKTLDYLCRRGDLNSYIAGEDLSRRSGPVRSLFHRYPQLRNNRYLNQKNRGITVVIL
ncbi:MAG: hypothetical protein ABFS19_06425 [Thermodesulfobacteriota bacterium]